jgi:hypothetical protein
MLKRVTIWMDEVDKKALIAFSAPYKSQGKAIIKQLTNNREYRNIRRSVQEAHDNTKNDTTKEDNRSK